MSKHAFEPARRGMKRLGRACIKCGRLADDPIHTQSILGFHESCCQCEECREARGQNGDAA